MRRFLSFIGSLLLLTVGLMFSQQIAGNISAFGQQLGGNQVTLLSITITPSSATIVNGNTQQFQAFGNYSNGDIQNITQTDPYSGRNTVWTATPPSGVVSLSSTPPTETATATGVGTATIAATNGAITDTAAATVTVSTIVITSGAPPAATVGSSYSFTFTSSGGSGGNTWSCFAGSCAQLTSDGFALSSGGVLSSANVTSATGSPIGFTVRVCDNTSHCATQVESLSINSSTACSSGGGPPNYPCTTTNLTTSVGTLTMPVCGGDGQALSATHQPLGCYWQSPLNPTSDTYTLITNNQTFGGQSVSGVTASGGDDDSMFSANETYLGLVINGGVDIFHMSITTCGGKPCMTNVNQGTGLPSIRVSNAFAFCMANDPNCATPDNTFYWITSYRKLHQGVITSDTTFTETVNANFPFDFAVNCPGIPSQFIGVNPSLGGLQARGGVFGHVMGWSGGQGTAHQMFDYKPGSGCAAYDTSNGNWWAYCNLGTGCQNLAPSGNTGVFNPTLTQGIHASSISFDGLTQDVSPGGCTNQANPCGGGSEIYWKIGTANVSVGNNGNQSSTLSFPHGQGHGAIGYTTRTTISPPNVWQFTMSPPIPVPTPVQIGNSPLFGGFLADFHNGAPYNNDTWPVVGAFQAADGSGCSAGGFTQPAPLCNENLGIAANYPEFRFGPTYSSGCGTVVQFGCSGTAQGFAGRYVIDKISPDGKWLAMPTDILQGLGNDKSNQPLNVVVVESLQ